MRLEKDILEALSGSSRNLDDLVIVGDLVVAIPEVPGGDPMALLIEDDELARDCRTYLIARGARVFSDILALSEDLGGRPKTSDSR